MKVTYLRRNSSSIAASFHCDFYFWSLIYLKALIDVALLLQGDVR